MKGFFDLLFLSQPLFPPSHPSPVGISHLVSVAVLQEWTNICCYSVTNPHSPKSLSPTWDTLCLATVSQKMPKGNMVTSPASPPYHPLETLNPDGKKTLIKNFWGSWDVGMQETLPKVSWLEFVILVFMGNIWRRLFGWEADGWQGSGRDLCLIPWAVNPAVTGISPFPVIPGKQNAAAVRGGCGMSDWLCGAKLLLRFLPDFWHWGDLLGCKGHPILTQEDERPGPYCPLSFPPPSPTPFSPSLGLPPIPVGVIPICLIPGCSLTPFCQGRFGGFFHLLMSKV